MKNALIEMGKPITVMEFVDESFKSSLFSCRIIGCWYAIVGPIRWLSEKQRHRSTENANKLRCAISDNLQISSLAPFLAACSLLVFLRRFFLSQFNWHEYFNLISKWIANCNCNAYESFHHYEWLRYAN